MKGEEKGNYCSELTAHNVIRERWGKGEVCGFGLNGSNRCWKAEGNVFCVISGVTAVPIPCAGPPGAPPALGTALGPS